MAGSYNHVVDENGNLIKNKPPRGAPFSDMIENLGDAYEAIEEMYGMIWYLASALRAYQLASGATGVSEEGNVELARLNYEQGLRNAKEVNSR